LTLFKFQYAVPMFVLFLIWRRWRFLKGFAISGTTVVALSIGLTGFSGFVTYVRSVVAMSAKYSAANGVLYGIHLDGMPNLRGLAYMSMGGSVLATQWIVLVCSAMVMIWASLKRPSMHGALLAALLVSYHQVIADTSLLILPVGLLLARGVTEVWSEKSGLAWSCACLALVAPTILLFANTRFYLESLPVIAMFLGWSLGGQSPMDFCDSARCHQTDTHFPARSSGY
jgi:hypothetical protein